MISPKKILIVRPDAIGDVTLMIPMINTLKKAYPNAKIYPLLQTYTAPLLEGHPSVEAVIIDKKRGFFREAKWLRAQGFDCVIHSYLDGYYAWLMVFAGIKTRIGDKNKVLLRPCLTHAVSQQFRQLGRHEVEHNLTLLTPLISLEKASLDMNIPVQRQFLPEVKLLLKKEGWNDEKLIGIHPTTGGGNRPWSPEAYARLIDHIHEKTPYKVVLTGFGKSDQEVIDLILKKSESQPINLCQKTSLPQLIAFISITAAMIGTDTGPTHIAAALKQPVLCISPTKFVKPLRWGPWGTRNEIVSHPEYCPYICNPYQCGKPDCLDSIRASEVFEKLEQLLGGADTEKFQEKWVQTSINIAVIMKDPREWPKIESFLEKARQEKLSTIVTATTTKAATFLKNKQISFEQNSWVNVPKTLLFLAKKDITIFQTFSHPPARWILWLYRQLVAPKVYCPPLQVSMHCLAKNQSLTTLYFNQLRK